MSLGLVFNIQRFCLHDGPGIRSILFIKGCPLRCKWCSNPESQNDFPELIYKEITCIQCGTCVAICPNSVFSLADNRLMINRSKCSNCGICAEKCSTKSLEICGKDMTIDKIMKALLCDRLFYEMSNGGVTLSGGEPLANISFCRSILAGLQKEGIHTAVETSGYVETNDIVGIAELVDLFLFDLKHLDQQVHTKGTGRSNELILKNLRALVSSGAKVIIRYPLIPGYNSGEHSLSMLVKIMGELGLGEIDIIPYHRLGTEKYKHLGRTYQLNHLEPPDKEDLLRAKNYLLTRGIEKVNLY